MDRHLLYLDVVILAALVAALLLSAALD